MKKIKLLLEYKCFPMWVYNETGELITNDLPEELVDDMEIDSMLVKIQEIYDGLFNDTPLEFAYVGFKDLKKKKAFEEKIETVLSEIQIKVGDKYSIVNEINI